MVKYFTMALIVVALLTTKKTKAQEFNAGLYGGLVGSQLDGDKYGGYHKAGMIGGAFVNREFKKKWSWQMGLRYNQKGSKQVDNKNGVYYKTQLHYIEMPLTIRYRHFEKVDLETGVAMGYLIKDKEDKDGYGLIDADPEFNKFEFSYLGGLNFHFNKKIAIGGHFAYSFLPVRPYSSLFDGFMDKGQYNNLVYFTLQYKLSSWR